MDRRKLDTLKDGQYEELADPVLQRLFTMFEILAHERADNEIAVATIQILQIVAKSVMAGYLPELFEKLEELVTEYPELFEAEDLDGEKVLVNYYSHYKDKMTQS